MRSTRRSRSERREHRGRFDASGSAGARGGTYVADGRGRRDDAVPSERAAVRTRQQGEHGMMAGLAEHRAGRAGAVGVDAEDSQCSSRRCAGRRRQTPSATPALLVQASRHEAASRLTCGPNTCDGSDRYRSASSARRRSWSIARGFCQGSHCARQRGKLVAVLREPTVYDHALLAQGTHVRRTRWRRSRQPSSLHGRSGASSSNCANS